MLVAKKEVSKIDVLNKKPLIRKNQSTGEMVAGFLDPETGVFEVAMEISDERDIDDFLEKYDLSVVMISKM
ncbi:MAG: aspartate dehydrogenase [Lachnospiraceae bacterium]|nr:aspartate dehydrogenase [Lachnospiraceae bacterium]